MKSGKYDDFTVWLKRKIQNSRIGWMELAESKSADTKWPRARKGRY